MNRRTDRTIAISAITAVVLVPTAVLAVLKTGGGSPKDAGEMPAAAAAAQHDPANASVSPVPGAPAGSAPTAPGGAPGATTPGSGYGSAGPNPGGGQGASGPGGGGSAHGEPKLKSFTRVTEVKLSGAANGDYQHITETATFTLSPQYAMSATGLRRTMKDGALSELTQKVIVSGGTLKAFDGKAWESSKLTAAQLAKLRDESDPRALTYLLNSIPGVGRSGPGQGGASHYVAKALMGDVYGQLPEEIAAATRKLLPDGTGVALDLWSDGSDRPSRIGLNAAAPGTSFTGSMTFKSYR